ncbi:hypothetical protein GCM10022254_20130 [Actinomadura meridiana]|uniref:DUF1778 domain-containing protein n=1 Tax=Actinomadura meridiana TaxID=559626 RepID=A0ABP8BWW1_9ACTN
MSESVRQNLPAADEITLHPSAEQLLVIRKAAELIGWTVTDYVMSALLDRAERDLYEHAAAREEMPPTNTEPVAPLTALLLAYT